MTTPIYYTLKMIESRLHAEMTTAIVYRKDKLLLSFMQNGE